MPRMVGLAVATVVVLCANPVVGEIGRERSVAIWVDLEGREHPSRGSGVLLCEREGRPQILTAHHVITGPRDEKSAEPPWRLHDVCSVRFDFSGGARLRWVLQPHCASGKSGYQSIALEKREAPALDLAVLVPLVEASAAEGTVPAYASVPVTALEGPAGTAQEGEQETEVFGMKDSVWERLAVLAIRPCPSTSKSSTLEPKCREEDDVINFSSSGVEQGYSGSGIWLDGHLVGVVTNAKRGVPIHRAMRAPLGIEADCWSTEGRSDVSVAHGLFRDGMEAAARRDWDEASERMKSAGVAWGNEGGILNLRGWRYTAYLPHYQYGRALFKLSQRKENLSERQSLCREANAELDQSLSNGHVRATKYYRRLRKMRGKCWSVLDEQSEAS